MGTNHRSRLNRLWLPIVGLLALSACLSNTLAQDLAFERWQQCSTYPTVTLKEVRTDGQVSVWYDPRQFAEYAAYQQCMRSAAAGQASKRPAAENAGLGPSPMLPPAEAPEWRRGHEWAFRWKSEKGTGTFIRSVDRVETIDGTEFYVTRRGAYESYWRRADLAFLMEKRRGGGIETRNTPPQTWYAWPLTVGKTWEQTYRRENQLETGVSEPTMRCAVDRQERVSVPAGVFDTFRIECRNKRTNRVMFRHWYAPAVSQSVKEEGFFSYGKRDRELIAFRLPQSTKPRVVSLLPEVPPALVKDDAGSAAVLRKASEAGDAHAMAKLGFLYFAGQSGLAKDDAEAVRWFRRGADAGDGLAMAFLGASYWTGLGGLSRDEVEALRWFRNGVTKRDGRAMALLGQAYLAGFVGLEKDDAEAVRWFQRGADAGDARAMAMLGQMYLSGGGGLTKDDATALRWLRRAAEAGDGFAMATIGSLQESGEAGLTKDEIEAVRWYRKGTAARNGRAMAALGRMYSEGRGGLTRNDTEAVRWYREGAALVDAVAMFQLGLAYEAGLGVAMDRQEAAHWYGRAASLGVADAFDRLAALEAPEAQS